MTVEGAANWLDRMDCQRFWPEIWVYFFLEDVNNGHNTKKQQTQRTGSSSLELLLGVGPVVSEGHHAASVVIPGYHLPHRATHIRVRRTAAPHAPHRPRHLGVCWHQDVRVHTSLACELDGVSAGGPKPAHVLPVDPAPPFSNAPAAQPASSGRIATAFPSPEAETRSLLVERPPLRRHQQQQQRKRLRAGDQQRLWPVLSPRLLHLSSQSHP